MIRAKRAWALTLSVVTCVAGVVVAGADKANHAPSVRLHGGAAWLASNKVGQMTLLDGASAEVAAKVPVAAAGTPLFAAQLGSTAYALNRWDGSIVRVDGATLEASPASKPLGSMLFPTPHTLYVLDSDRGLLSPLDPVTLAPQGPAHSLATKVSPEDAVVDGEGRLWVLDQRTGDLAWFAGGTRHSIDRNGPARIAVTDGHPVLLDLSTGGVALLDSSSGSAIESVHADVRPDDTVLMAGSTRQRQVLITIPTRGLLMVCTFGAACKDPVPLGSGKADLGAAVEVGDHAIVPDYSTGRVWIVNLATMHAIERQLFPGPVRFELQNRDGVVFYNDPDSDQAGVLDLDGTVHGISKYNPTKPDAGPNQVGLESPNTVRQAPPTKRPGSPDSVPPVKGPGRLDQTQPPVGAPMADIVVKPGSRGLVGDEFTLDVVARSTIGVATARWDFGDGSDDATGLSVRHKWSSPGQFQVSVAPTMVFGLPAQIVTATVVIEPAGTPPRIDSISVDPATPQVGEAVRFSANVSGDQSGQWEWIIRGPEGAVVASSRLHDFQHAFTGPGGYEVALAVSAGSGRDQRSRPLIVAPEPPAARCGDVLTASAMLRSDLVCPGDGVTIAADNVTFDLRGHTLSTDDPGETSTGIKIGGSRTIQNTTVKNGTITRFKTGVGMTDVSGVTLSAMNVMSSAENRVDTEVAGDVYGINARNVQISGAHLSGRTSFKFHDNSEATITDSTLSNDAQNNSDRPEAVCTRRSKCSISKSTLRALFWRLDHLKIGQRPQAS
ncbi:PKD domain-containing protein, partial [Kibdelosporangium philippinense]